jgi:hypothetical protein|tara:strand:+ start:720 stop:1076 length:357 start_codon:yes stop_codon:yes gene_type:complete
MNNIVKFPNDYTPPEQETLSDLKKSIEKNKEIYINNVVDQHSSNLLANISLSGFDIDRDEFMKDFAFTVETIRSSLYRNMGLHHHFQEHIDTNVEITGVEELSDDEQMSLDFGKREDE